VAIQICIPGSLRFLRGLQCWMKGPLDGIDMPSLKGSDGNQQGETGRDEGWWAVLGLNQRPRACEARALPLS
jgi:hypothetical protein